MHQPYLKIYAMLSALSIETERNEKKEKRREKQNILVQSLLSHLGLTAKDQLKIHEHWTTSK